MSERRARTPEKESPEERALARFRVMLKEKGLNASTVRDAIARAALGFKGHFDVNDLAQVLSEAGVSGAHLTTVYRTLPLLLEAGIVKPALLFSGDRHVYEAAFEREHHDHLICTDCGTIVEFHFEALEALQRDVAAQYGFELTSHVHELLGRCEACRRGKAPKPVPGMNARSTRTLSTDRRDKPREKRGRFKA